MVGWWLALIAGASASEVSLEWSAPAVCPAAAEIEREAAYLVGRTVTFGAPARFAVRAVIRSEWIAEVELSSARGVHQRVLSAASCAELAHALALIISLSIEEQPEPVIPAVEVRRERRVVAGVIAGSGSESEPEVEVEVEDELLRRTKGAARSRSLKHGLGAFALSAGAFGDMGTLPAISLGLSASLFWRPLEYLSLGTGGSILLAQRAVIRSVPEAGGAMGFGAAHARACLHAPSLGGFELAACGGAELAFLSAHGFGVTTTRRATSRWAAPLAALTVTYPLGDRVGLALFAESAFPTVRPIFVLDGVGEVHRTPAVLARAGFAVEVHFP